MMNENEQDVIKASGLRKSYRSGNICAKILDDVGLTIKEGEITFLVGPSGSGKTTLLSILGCILSPDAGELEVLGTKIKALSAKRKAKFRRDNLGFIFQNFNLFPTISALDNLCLAMMMKGFSMAPSRKRSLEILEQVGLGKRYHLRPALLSTGECQRVAIARALVNDPKILFADEPTASLDADNGHLAMSLLTQMVRDRGMTLVVVTHDARIFSFSDRIFHLENGGIKNDSQTWENYSKENAIEQLPAYLARGITA